MTEIAASITPEEAVEHWEFALDNLGPFAPLEELMRHLARAPLPPASSGQTWLAGFINGVGMAEIGRFPTTVTLGDYLKSLAVSPDATRVEHRLRRTPSATWLEGFEAGLLRVHLARPVAPQTEQVASS